jgi:hypothetical protein
MIATRFSCMFYHISDHSTSVGLDPNASSSESKEEMDARSVYVGNVRFSYPLFTI